MSINTADQHDPAAELSAALEAVTQGGSIRTIDDLRAWTSTLQGFLPQALDPVGRLHDAVLIGEVDGRKVVADVVVPKGDGPFPIIVYIHGGGWVLGSREEYRGVACGFASKGYLVVSVDYALAPENRFPAGFDDCAFAVRWAAERAADFGGDSSRLVVAGDSAGANLTAAVCASFADDASAPAIDAVLLFYGVYDMPNMPRGDTEDSAALCDEIINAYLGPDREALLDDPRVSPLHAAGQLPRAFVVVGGADDLVGQAEQMRDALTAAGVEHEYLCVEGMPHAFLQLPVPPAEEALQRSVDFLGLNVATA